MNIPDEVSNYIEKTLPTLDGWCTQEKAKALANEVVAIQPSVIYEIGVFAGRSLIAMALACPSASVVGIDPWMPSASTNGFDPNDPNSKWWSKCDHDAIYRQCVDACAQTGALQNTLLMRGTSQQVAELLRRTHPSRPFIDMLHIDGNHSETHSVQDVNAWVPIVRSGGIICFDDTNWDCTKKAQELLAEMCEFKYFVEANGQQCGFYTKKQKEEWFVRIAGQMIAQKQTIC